MEIPTVKIELYKQSKERFAQELDHALRTTSVAQVSGLEQQLVHDLYGYMQEHIDEFNLGEGFYLGKDFYRQRFLDKESEIKPHTLRKHPYLHGLVKEVRKNISGIRNRLINAVFLTYGQRIRKFQELKSYRQRIRKSQELKLFRYYRNYQKQGLFHPGGMARKKHIDKVVLFCAPTASAPGLEGKIKGRWKALHPEPGHLLVGGGEGLESISDGEIKPLLHRVQYPASERWALLYA